MAPNISEMTSAPSDIEILQKQKAAVGTKGTEKTVATEMTKNGSIITGTRSNFGENSNVSGQDYRNYTQQRTAYLNDGSTVDYEDPKADRNELKNNIDPYNYNYSDLTGVGDTELTLLNEVLDELVSRVIPKEFEIELNKMKRGVSREMSRRDIGNNGTAQKPSTMPKTIDKSSISPDGMTAIASGLSSSVSSVVVGLSGTEGMEISSSIGSFAASMGSIDKASTGTPPVDGGNVNCLAAAIGSNGATQPTEQMVEIDYNSDVANNGNPSFAGGSASNDLTSLDKNLFMNTGFAAAFVA